jgi:hypothetical protein
LTAQFEHTAQELSLPLQGACLAGAFLPAMSMQLAMVIPGIVIVTPGTVFWLPAMGIAQAGAAPLRNIPNATTTAAIRCTKSLPNMLRNIRLGTLWFKDGPAG